MNRGHPTPIAFDPERSFKLDLDDLKLIQQIGGGNFSKVYEGLYQGQRVAIKKQELSPSSASLVSPSATTASAASAHGSSGNGANDGGGSEGGDDLVGAYLHKELKMLKTIAHPNLLQYVGANFDGSTAYIVTEFMEGGDLRRLLLGSPDVADSLGLKILLQFFASIAAAVAYLHDRELMHRDIKTQNIVLDANMRAVLCDFGFAREASHAQQAMTICGTDEFMAPEIIFGMDYGLAADIYSLGVVGCEILCRKAPGSNGFLVREPRHGFEVNMADVRAAVVGSPPTSWIECIAQMCTSDPDDRLGAVDAEDWLHDLLQEMPDDPFGLVLDTSSGGGLGRWSAAPATAAQGGVADGTDAKKEGEEKEKEKEAEKMMNDGGENDMTSGSASDSGSGIRGGASGHSAVNNASQRLSGDQSSHFGTGTNSRTVSTSMANGVALNGVDVYKQEDFLVDIDRLEFGAEIGRGQFSCVYEGVYRGERVAVKKQRLETQMIDKYLRQELSILKNVEHPNLLRYLGANVKGDDLYVVTEYHQGGDLRHLLQLSEVEMGWDVVVEMLLQVSKAIEHLHGLELIHRDIKTQNIVLGRNLTVILCDFGFARHASQRQQAMTICGTDEFMAPEIIFGMEYGVAADMFSLGVVACEVIARRIPGEGGFLVRQPMNGFEVNMDEVTAVAPDMLPPALLELNLKLCSNSPETRPAARDAVKALLGILNALPVSKTTPLYVGGSHKWFNHLEDHGDAVSSPRSPRRPQSLRSKRIVRRDSAAKGRGSGTSVTMGGAGARTGSAIAAVASASASAITTATTTGTATAPEAVSNIEPQKPGIPDKTAPDASQLGTSRPGREIEAGDESIACPSTGHHNKRLTCSSELLKPTTAKVAHLCAAPNCLTLQRHASGFCAVHAFLRPFAFVAYASKRGGMVKTWRRRFFALKQSTLFYYKTMDSVRKCAAPQGRIHLSQKVYGKPCIDILPDAQVMQGRQFCVRLHTDKRTYYLQFDTGVDRQSFLEAIQSAVSRQ
jgi:serine/threonine protein kinase